MHIAGRAVPAYAVSGSPAMAVAHAVLELTERPIDLCVSGINYGENIGESETHVIFVELKEASGIQQPDESLGPEDGPSDGRSG